MPDLLMISRVLVVAALSLPMSAMLHAQRPASPAPSGNRIVARDGDVVVVAHEARIRIVTERLATVRVVHNAAERWLLILVDDARTGAPSDGNVDFVYTFRNVEGAWPFETPWDGVATIEDYSTTGRRGFDVGIATPGGLVQVLGAQTEFRDANAVAVLTQSAGGSMGTMGDISFDEAERWFSAELHRNDGTMRSPAGVIAGAALSFTPEGGIAAREPGVNRLANGAVRVEGRVRPPVKTVDVRPVTPEAAARANIRGVVIIEVTIDIDGAVKDARLLRSIPLLDAAALDAVRQWRFEPTVLDGVPVRVVMTVTVAFR